MKLLVCVALLGALSSCKKPTKKTETEEQAVILKKEILANISATVIYPTYVDMALKSDNLYTSLITFSNTTNAYNLAACQQAWRDIRTTWELSEGFLFGPVEIDNIDPRIDTWPIDFQRIDSVLSSSVTLDPTYVNNLEDPLKGFHPIEYLLFGNGNAKSPTVFTAREKEFLIALADNLKALTHQLKNSWDPAITANYSSELNSAGSGSTVFQTQRAAYEQLMDAMIDICDEVANSKISEPYTQQNATLEESPFAGNSMIDFTNNIKSAQNIYLGKYVSDGKGLEELIKSSNLSMDGTIKIKFGNAITSLNNITVPFGQAIFSQQTQVQNAITAINDLGTYLEGTVKPYLQQVTN